jgi:hypothetical protein
MKVLDEKIIAIEKVHREFVRIMQHERCRTCSCLHTDMMASILDTIQEVTAGKISRMGMDTNISIGNCVRIVSLKPKCHENAKHIGSI